MLLSISLTPPIPDWLVVNYLGFPASETSGVERAENIWLLPSALARLTIVYSMYVRLDVFHVQTSLVGVLREVLPGYHCGGRPGMTPCLEGKTKVKG